MEICQIMERQILTRFPSAQVLSVPVADGGEGTVDAIRTACGGSKHHLTVQGPYGEGMSGFWGLLPDGRTAVIEMACCAGIPLVAGRENPAVTSTYGVGELMLAAAKSGAEKIILGLGGSATNDAGCGAACAVGVRFYDENNVSFIPVGATLCKIHHIDTSGLAQELQSKTVILMCDVDNLLYGPNGAACTFAPQKGANEDMVERLDFGLRHFSNIVERSLGKAIGMTAGGGAAGGMGAGFFAFFNTEMKRGIDVVLDLCQFDLKLDECDVVFTGEGRFDSQSLHGKVVQGVSVRASRKGVPIIVIAGDVDIDALNSDGTGITAVFSINNLALDFDTVKHRCRQDLSFVMDNIVRIWR